MTKTQTTVEQIKELLKTLNREELVEVEVAARSEMGNHEPSIYEARMIELARDEHHKDGECEIDEGNAVVSESDKGAYVMAWVWVYDTEAVCDECGEEFTASEGCDGLCPSCSGESENA